jgi:glycosyltransferase involved in cell wall biosynthesis
MIISKLSIIIPVFNEESTIIQILNKILSIDLINNIKQENIAVNDCSTDNTDDFFEKFIRENSYQNI